MEEPSVNYVYQLGLALPAPARADLLSVRELFTSFPWGILAELGADYEAARLRYYKDNAAMAQRLGPCPKKRRTFKERVAGLFREVFLGGGSPADDFAPEAGGEAEEDASAAGSKGIPFLPQLKAWLVAPFCGYPANGRAVARMLRCRSDLFAMCNFPDSVPPDERQMRRFNAILYRHGLWNEIKRRLVLANIEAEVVEGGETLIIDTSFTADFATLGKAPLACTRCAQPCAEPEKTCELTGIVAKSNSDKRPGLKVVAFVTPHSELPLDARVLLGSLHESQTLRPMLDPFVENFPRLAAQTRRVIADAVIANGPNRAYLAEALPAAELIGQVNPRSRKPIPKPARGIESIDPYGVPHCTAGHKLFLLGRDRRREQYIWACPVYHPESPETELACPSKSQCSASRIGRIFRVDRGKTPQVRWEAPEHSKRHKALYALRTAIERYWSRHKITLLFGRAWARGSLALQAHADRMVITAHVFARAAWEAGKALLARSYTALTG
jgi:Transposase DDE domain